MLYTQNTVPAGPGSPSSRRAWIEILLHAGITAVFKNVALLAEGVDRNNLFRVNEHKSCRGRPPRGGRG